MVDSGQWLANSERRIPYNAGFYPCPYTVYAS